MFSRINPYEYLESRGLIVASTDDAKSLKQLGSIIHRSYQSFDHDIASFSHDEINTSEES